MKFIIITSYNNLFSIVCLLQQLRRNDPNITVGLSTWVQLFSTDENREESFRLGLKMRLCNFCDRITHFMISHFVIKILGIILLLPYKEDIHLNRSETIISVQIHNLK